MFSWLEGARTRWHREPFVPLHVRTWLSAPVSWDGRDAITLDGVLQFAVVLLETGRLPDDVFAELPSPSPRIDLPIPIADRDVGGTLIACASWGRPARCAIESLRYRRKRARAEAYNIERVGISGGWAKSLNLPIATLTTPYLDFAVVGNEALVRELLREVGGIGRDHNRGLGSVLGHEVWAVTEDHSLLRDGVPQRSLPLAADGGASDPRRLASSGWEERVVATRAPYWHQTGRVRCAVPIISVEPYALV